MRAMPEALRVLLDRRLRERARVLVAIDGPCGGGKSTLGEALMQAYEGIGCVLFHMDDFFLPPDMRTLERLLQPGGNVHHERFLSDVLIPLSMGQPFTYRKYDCQTGQYSEEHAVPARLIVVEGAYSLHRALREYYDTKVFLEINPKTQLERLRLRVGPQRMERFVSDWIPLENRYFDALNVRSSADIILHADT